VTEWSEVADHLPLLAPEIEPPPGFAQRVAERRRGADRRHRRRLVVLVAAVAAAVAIVSVVAVRLVESGNGTSTAAVAPTQRSIEIAMRTDGNRAPAGWAYVNGHNDVALTVDYRVPDAVYTVQVTDATGATTRLGTMRVQNGGGTWTGHSPAPIGTGSTIALVSSSGLGVCQGTVGPDSIAD
jgi:hypothetical protein